MQPGSAEAATGFRCLMMDQSHPTTTIYSQETY